MGWLQEKFLSDMASIQEAQGFLVPLFWYSVRDFIEAIGAAPYLEVVPYHTHATPIVAWRCTEATRHWAALVNTRAASALPNI